MKPWRGPCGWRLLFLVFIALLAEVHGSGAEAAALPRLFPTEGSMPSTCTALLCQVVLSFSSVFGSLA